MITLTLLHPLQSTPVQSWPFETESVIQIGRSNDNDVVLYSAVVSRHHVEIQRHGSAWEVVNKGANGTYINGKRVERTPAENGMIIRLASSGPKIKIELDESVSKDSIQKMPRKRSSSKDKEDKSRETLIDAYGGDT